MCLQAIPTATAPSGSMTTPITGMSASVAIRLILRLTMPASGSLTRQLPKPQKALSIRNAPSARRFLKPQRSPQQAALIPTATVQSGSMTAPTTGMSASAATKGRHGSTQLPVDDRQRPLPKEATGIKHEECTVCGAKRSENTVIDKLPDGGNTSNTGSSGNNTNKPGNDDSTKCPQTGDSSNHRLAGCSVRRSDSAGRKRQKEKRNQG